MLIHKPGAINCEPVNRFEHGIFCGESCSFAVRCTSEARLSKAKAWRNLARPRPKVSPNDGIDTFANQINGPVAAYELRAAWMCAAEGELKFLAIAGCEAGAAQDAWELILKVNWYGGRTVPFRWIEACGRTPNAIDVVGPECPVVLAIARLWLGPGAKFFHRFGVVNCLTDQ